jgi:hypothetical protein
LGNSRKTLVAVDACTVVRTLSTELSTIAVDSLRYGMIRKS